ncbi:MAG: hypothetical protein ACMUIE_01825 [Thermoplasmatota archaeon]
MKTKVMAIGGLAALVLLVSVALFAAAGGAGEDGPIGEGLFGEKNENGSEGGNGEMERAMDGSCEGEPQGEPMKEQTQEQTKSEGANAPEEADQTREREQLQEGSCEGEPQGEPVKEQTQEQSMNGSCSSEEQQDDVMLSTDSGSDVNPQGIQQQDRDRDQVNGGTGPQYHGDNSQN